MASLNEVRLLGNLGADPDLRVTQGGTAVATLSIATTRVYTDKNNDEIEETEWHRVVVWAGQAESVAKHKRKGDQVLVVGRLQTRKWTDDKGVDRWSTEVVAQQVIFTGRAPKSGAPHPADDPNMREPERRNGAGSKRDDGPPPDDDFGLPPEPNERAERRGDRREF